MLKRLLLLITMVLLSACAGLAPKSDSLKVNLSDMQMLDSTLMEQRFRVKIRLQNRSQSSLYVDGLSFDLALNDRDFASGVSDQNLTIAPLSESVLAVNLTSTLFALMRQFQAVQALKTKPFRYELSGTIYTRNSIFGIPFSEKGEIDLTTPSDAI
ncbi:MAG: LEA type 2 family protein [Gammaproteobacteria bacterium]|nr:LEA type 2 family protein [Gammaproteobacteria bacterium]